ncbi:unnamed protein product [Acanthoscelides obtectus]|nr:unnamed protein product [Acanthoscelides obtectus]CAH2014391.1 unnamed protein product [Acanthoscelides obtectus]CAK1626102.1 hypothetical protein AOBTE_LOCUS3609 [Acanthoscelides obtectus]CAK1626121.1 hypothetical protein AOBTE_LOCUS3627 [Acanthoscelides obtectus]
MKDARDIFNKTQEKCPNLKTDAEDVLKKVGECVVKIEMGSKTICQVIKEKIPKCSKPIIDLITPCVEEQHQYLVRLTFKMVQALMDQACNSTVEELLELFNPCVIDVEEEEENKFESCKRINEKMKDDLIPTKEEMCKLKSDGYDCMKELTKKCENPLTKKSSLDFAKVADDVLADMCA